MSVNMAAEGNTNINNLVQTPAFQETINSILTATNQEQSCLLLQLKSRKTRVLLLHSDFLGNCLTISHMC